MLHIQQVHQDQGFANQHKCEFCDKTFHKRMFLRFHIRTVHKNENEENITCDECEKPFKNQYYLKIHKTTEHAEKIFGCEFCGKLFGGSQRLKNHVKVIHEGIRDFICHYCNKTFGSSGNRDKHISK